MSFPKLTSRNTTLAVLVAMALVALRPAAARADSNDAPSTVRLALAATPAAGAPVAIDAPAAPAGDAPPAQPATGRSSWWVWAAIAAAVAGIAVLVVTSSGKDPACPSDRTCM
jgi:hypothetical protein